MRSSYQSVFLLTFRADCQIFNLRAYFEGSLAVLPLFVVWGGCAYYQHSGVLSDLQRRDRQYLATYNGHERECVHTGSAETSRVDCLKSPAELRALVPHVSFSAVGFQWSGKRAPILRSEIYVEKWFLLVEDHQAICDASHCDHQNSLQQLPASHNCVQNKRVETFNRCRVLYLCSAESTPN